MTPSLSNGKILSAAVVQGISPSIKGRGFSAAASQGIARVGRGGSNSSVMAKKGVKEKDVPAPHRPSWVPDPKTGYYRPDDVAEQVDAAELRAALLKQNN
ncbi:hypothetical protein SAY86_008938 [Trapa natans]|uniref:Uncharacterized protein n=1 Tax=Trapa natans TaxID=22666 RepID=A0AAN7K9I5_TRANT|nr:hypothetical protein SAY86_008938 [Trapa natans]